MRLDHWRNLSNIIPCSNPFLTNAINLEYQKYSTWNAAGLFIQSRPLKYSAKHIWAESSEPLRAFFISLISKEYSIKVAFWVNNRTSLPQNLPDSFFCRCASGILKSPRGVCEWNIIQRRYGILFGDMGSKRRRGGCRTGRDGPSVEQLYNAQTLSFIFTLVSLHKLAPQLLETWKLELQRPWE